MPPRLRAALVAAHRWGGLAVAPLLCVAGLTGAVLPFQHALDAALNPALFGGASAGPPLPPSALAAAVERAFPSARVTSLFFAGGPGTTVRLGVAGRDGPVAFNQVFVDPATGAVRGTRRFGGCRPARETLVPLLWELHFTLCLPRPWGAWLMGGAAPVWLADCFLAPWLTLPRGAAGGLWRRWRPAWTVKRRTSAYRVVHDLHRAGGLWPWGLMAVVALTSVVLNLPELARPVVTLASPPTAAPYEGRAGLGPRPAISFDRALAVARAEAALQGWTAPPRSILHLASHGVVAVRFHRPEGPGLGQQWVYLDDATGAVLSLSGVGEGSAGDAFLALQVPLHGGSIAGLPGRILASAVGLAVAMLSVTGVVVWWRKRRARRGRAAGRA